MKSTQKDAIWVSNTFEQGSAESDWKDYQTEIRSTPIPVDYFGGGHYLAPEADNTAIISETGVTQYVSSPILAWDDYDYPNKPTGNAPGTAVTFNSSAQESALTDVTLSYDSSKMFLVGTSRIVYAYTLSTPGNPSTATYVNSFSLTSQLSVVGRSAYIKFSVDGTKLYAQDHLAGTIYQYTLTTAWDLSTASYASKSHAVTGGGSYRGMSFSYNGKILMYVNNSSINKATLGTAWDISTATYSSTNTYNGVMKGLYVSRSGKRVYSTIGTNLDFQPLSTAWDSTSQTGGGMVSLGASQYSGVALANVGNYLITTDGASTVRGYPIQDSNISHYPSSTSRFGGTQSISGLQGSAPKGVGISADGTKLYYNIGATIYQYALSIPFDVTSATSNSSFSTATQSGSMTHMYIDPTGTYVFTTNSSTLYKYTLGTPWSISTASITNNKSLSAFGSVGAITFSPDGLHCYVTDSSSVKEGSMTAAWDISTLTYTGRSFTASQAGSLGGLVVSKWGEKIMVSYSSGTYAGTVEDWYLSTPFSLSGAYKDAAWGLSGPGTGMSGMTFSPDGKNIYFGYHASNTITQVTGTVNGERAVTPYSYYPLTVTTPNAVYRKPKTEVAALLTANRDVLSVVDSTLYTTASTTTTATLNFDNTVDTAYAVNDSITIDKAPYWDVSQYVYSTSKTVTAKPSQVSGIHFSPDGKKMFLGGYSYVYQWNLSTAWDVTSATWVSTSNSISNCNTICFSADGTNMYATNTGVTDYINQYSMAAWDTSTLTFVGSKSFVADESTIGGVLLNPTGTKVFIVGTSNNVRQYTLATPWVISSAQTLSASLYVASQVSSSGGQMAFNATGTKLYVFNTSNDTIYQYNLPTPWTLTSGSFDSKSKVLSAQDATAFAANFSADGKKMYMGGGTNQTIYEYAIAADTATTTISSISVTGGKTTLTHPTQSAGATLVSLNGRSYIPAVTSYDVLGGDVVAYSDRTALANGKRYAKFKVVSSNSAEQEIADRLSLDAIEEVTNVKLNLWKV